MLASIIHTMPILADDEFVQGVPVFVVLIGGCIGTVISVAILIAICLFLSGCLKRIPNQYRTQQPNMVWLLCIPCFNVVWNFFVYPKIAESYKAYFDSIGRTDVGDCGKGLALAYCILFICSCIPYLNFCTGLPTLIVWILVLVKFAGFKNQMPQAADGTAPGITPA